MSEKGFDRPIVVESPTAVGGPRRSRRSEREAEVFANALFGPRLTTEEKFGEFLDETEWANSHIDPIRPDAPPSYYVEMTPEDRKDHKIVIDFANAANFKMSPPQGLPPNLDTLSKCPEVNGFSLKETQRLYEIPGVRRALEVYVRIFDSDQPMGTRPNGEQYSLRTAKTRDELNICRAQIRREIRTEVLRRLKAKRTPVKGLDIDLKCREAEQAAWSFAYIGGLFESLDSRWNNEGRTRPAECFNDLVNVPIKLAMEPLDALINTFKKSTEEVAPYGRFGKWGYEMAMESNKGKPLNIKIVHLIRDENGYQNDYWKVTNNGQDITIPECYPLDLIKSIFEETQAGEHNILYYLRAGLEIPWDKIKDSMWSDYSSKLSKAQVLLDTLQGKNLIRWGEYENVGLWIQDVSNALAKFGLRNADSVKRWMLYASAGIDDRSRAPKLRDPSRRLSIIGTFGPKLGGYLTYNKLLFPWDRRGFFN